MDLVRTELRRRRRAEDVAGRKQTRAVLAGGTLPDLETVVSAPEPLFDPAIPLDELRFLRESATEVRLGYAGGSRQSLSLTDGRAGEEVYDLAGARRLWALGWEFGTPQARGVRIYPAGSRAERIVPATEVHVEPPPG
jgi:hypothetical protein